MSLLAGLTVAVPSLALALRSTVLLRRERAQRLHNEDMVEHLSEGIYRSSLDGHQLNANKALVRLNGFDSKEEMLAAVTDIERQWYVDPNRRSQFREILMRDGKVEDFISEIYRYKTRERIWITESARLVRDVKSGKPIYYEGSVREITETVQRLDQEEQFRKLTRRLPVGLFHFASRADGSATILFLSETASRISGIPMADQISTPSIFVEVVHPEDLALFRQAQQHSAQTLEPWDCEFRIKALDGEEKWLRVNAQLEAAGNEIHWYGYIADISSRKQQDMEIEELAYYDPLTKLPNRRMFFNRMTQSLTHCRRSGDFGSLLYIDLDNFKTLNDTQGHDTGDALLVQVAARLKSCVSPRDLVARIGGDEFVIVIEDAASDEGNATLRGITVGNRVVAELKRGFDIGNLHHVGSANDYLNCLLLREDPLWYPVLLLSLQLWYHIILCYHML